MPTTKQENALKEIFISNMTSVGDQVLEWVRDNFNPGDVFPEKELFQWAKDNCEPDSIFPDDTLGEWAENNGYEKK